MMLQETLLSTYAQHPRPSTRFVSLRTRNIGAGNHALAWNFLNMQLLTPAVLLPLLTTARKHTVEYLDAWIERTQMNGGIVPSNIGLDGTIGGECDGKWWGGVYGWGFSCVDIHDLPTDTPALELEKQGKATRVWRGLGQSYGFVCPGGFANGLLLTGDQKYELSTTHMSYLDLAQGEVTDYRTVPVRIGMWTCGGTASI